MRRVSAVAVALLAALAISSVFVPVALAQTPPRTGSEQVLYAVSASDIQSVLTARNYLTDVSESNGSTSLRVYATAEAKAQGDPLFIVGLAACNVQGRPPGCLGVHFFRIQRLNPNEEGRADRFVSSFHARFSFGRVYVAQNTFLVLDYYTMLDFGVTPGHLDAVVNEYVGLISEFSTLWGQTQ
jgi:hypothetical protein